MRPIKEGTKLKVQQDNGEELIFTVYGVNGSKVNLQEMIIGYTITYSYSQLAELIACEKVSFLYATDEESKLYQSSRIDFASSPEKHKKQAKRRLEYINQIKDDGIETFTEKSLTPSIQKTATRLGDKAPNWRTVERWIKSYNAIGGSIRGLLPDYDNVGKKKNKFGEEVEDFIAKAIESFKKMEKPSVTTAYSKLKILISNYNAEVVSSKELKQPKYNTFYNRICKEAPYELSKAREGKKITRANFRERQDYQKTTRILERAEIDHTILDLYVVDDKNLIPLGRPYITSIIDHYSRSILGFNIGFEAADHVAVTKALKHAIAPKTYVKEIYPEIVNEWLTYGKPAKLVTDRGMEFESLSMDDICLDLGIILQRNPAKMPWYKGRIESHFDTINKELLDDKPGKTFSNIIKRGDYDPEKNAIIRFSAFIKIFHIWVIDIYQQSPRAESSLVPDTWWRESAEIYPPIPISTKTLDIIIAVTKKRTIQKYGIKIDHIVYDSEELFKYRCKKGFINVNIKYNPDDIGSIFILNTDTNTYFEARAINLRYAAGLSVYQHKIIRQYLKDKIQSSVNPENLDKAKEIIQKIVDEELNHKKAHTRARASRLAKITQTETIKKTKKQTPSNDNETTVKVETVSSNKPEKESLSKNTPKPKPTGWGSSLRLGGSDDY
ncbi:Mu transposase C-terminal domain-containing protein [Endozoicomonas elysicola]|uniref:Integrase catalytic domain-containing protein n=1 Tax=Endozoicomonas elysicola TaxID=305900 RepID=A0A081KFP3_9GAMM|nr:Mu transposase C-terminal domain-containing protein [Endozoicomonas elysicola]KEI72969.1 hypothetical protein GV64_21600 [Endozoicomonas elysicola]